MIHTIQGFCIVNEADIFLEFSCFFNDPADVGNLISGSSTFPKSILNIWKFSVHVLLKPSLENFQHYFARVWNECNCVIVWIFFEHCVLGFSFQVFKMDFKKAEESDQIANVCWCIEKAREFQKNIYFCFIDYTKIFVCVDYNKLWKILKKMGLTRPLDLPLQKSVCRSRSNS